MWGVLPISSLEEQEAEKDFRTGTYFSISEVIAAKVQLWELWSQLIEKTLRAGAQLIFSDWFQTQITQRKSSLEIIQVRSARNDVLLLHRKAKPEMRVAVNEPIHGEPAHCETASSKWALMTPCTMCCVWLDFPEEHWRCCHKWLSSKGNTMPGCSCALLQPGLAQLLSQTLLYLQKGEAEGREAGEVYLQGLHSPSGSWYECFGIQRDQFSVLLFSFAQQDQGIGVDWRVSWRNQELLGLQNAEQLGEYSHWRPSLPFLTSISHFLDVEVLRTAKQISYQFDPNRLGMSLLGELALGMSQAHPNPSSSVWQPAFSSHHCLRAPRQLWMLLWALL